MGCLAFVLALVLPRLTLFLIWVFTGWVAATFRGGWFWPVLGFFFMPYTTLAFVGGVVDGGFGPVWIVIIVIAMIVDISHWGMGYRVAHTNR